MTQEQVDLIIQAHDRSSAVLNQINRSLAGVQAQLGRVQQQARQTHASLTSLGSAFTSVGDMAGRALSSLFGLFRSLLGHITQLAGAILGSLVGAFQALATAAGAAATVIGGTFVAAMVAVGKTGVEFRVTLEAADRALTKISGSAPLAGRLIAGLREEAKTSRLTFAELLPLAQSLGAVFVESYGPQGLGRVIPTMRAFGDVAATLGADQSAIQRALIQFRQVASGLIERESLKTIEENLPGAGVLGIVRKTFGTVDTQELQDAGVTGAMVADAIVKGFQDRFGGAQQEMQGTLPMILARFADTFNEIAASLTAKFTPAITKALGAVLQLFEKIAGNEKLIAALSVPFDLLGKAAEAAAAQLPAFVEWLEGILTRENVINVLSQIVGWFQALVAEVGRFISAATGGGGLPAIWKAFQDAAGAAIQFVLRLWNAFVAGVEYLVQNSGQLWAVFNDGLKAARAGFEALIGAVTVLVGLLVGGKLGGALGGLMQFGAGLAGLLGLGGAGGGGAGGAGLLGGGLLPIGVGLLGGFGFGQLARDRPDSVAGQFLSGTDKFRRWAWGEGGGGRGGSQGGSAGAAGAAGSAAGGVFGWLRGIGQGVLGQVPGVMGAAGAAIPDRLKNFGGGFFDAVRAGYNADPLAALMGNQQQAAAAAKKALTGMLGGGGKPGSDLPPSTMLLRTGGTAGAAAPAGMDAKQLKELLALHKEQFDAALEQAQAFAEAYDEEDRAFGKMQALVPVLVIRQRQLLEDMAKVHAGTKQHADLQAQYWDAQAKVAKLQRDAADEQHKAIVKAQREATETLSSQVQLTEERIKTIGMFDPARADMLKRTVLAGQGKALLGNLAQPVIGETPAEMLKRMGDVEGLKRDILGAQGVMGGGMGRTLGGGQMFLGNSRAAGAALLELDRIAAAGANRGPGGTAGRTSGLGTLVINLSNLSPEQARAAVLSELDRQLRGLGR